MADCDHPGSFNVLPHQCAPPSFRTTVLLLPGKNARHTRRHSLWEWPEFALPQLLASHWPELNPGPQLAAREAGKCSLQ